MKNTILTTLIAAATMFAAAPAADAQRHHHHHQRHHNHPHAQHSSYVFISGYQACGTPIYTERYIIRHDRRSRPVYGYRNVRHHRPHHVRPAPRGYRVAPCPPPRHHSRGYISIRF